MDSGPGSSVEVGTVSLKEPDPTSSRVTFGVRPHIRLLYGRKIVCVTSMIASKLDRANPGKDVKSEHCLVVL